MANETDTLVKPDMVAVVQRTHLSKDLHGFLLPTLEAVSNAMHGIDARFDENARRDGKIEIAFTDFNDPEKVMVSVTDNGSGLNDENYRSFKTPFSGHKLKQNGRGFGRFIAFKVFKRALYSSRFEAEDAPAYRGFRFDIKEPNELLLNDGVPDFLHSGVRVEYDEPLPEWNDLIRSLDRKEISDHIGGHFLPYFLNRQLPEITLQFDADEPENIIQSFQERIHPVRGGIV